MIVSPSGFLEALRKYKLVDEAQVDRIELAYHGRKDDARFLANEMIALHLLTPYQAGVILAGSAAELSLGDHIVLDLLGEGGMGRVYKARHRRLKRIDAIKEIRPDRVANKATLDRFEREAEVMSKLNHANIIKVFDCREADGRNYIVMEFIDGVDLGYIVSQKGALSVGQACACIRQAALGLQHAHERGLIHRDIKPSNLLVARHAPAGERVKVLDLGLARLREQPTTASGLTQQGQMMGTPDYMAPEQAEDSTTVDIRADIYALGCSLYQLLSGSVPFPGGNLLDKLTNHSKTPPRRIDGIPDVLWAALEKMLAKSRESRFPEPARVAVALAPFSDPEVTPPEPEPTRADDGLPKLSGMSLLPRTLDHPSSARRSVSMLTEPPPIAGDMTEASPVVESPRVPEKREASPTYLAPESALWSLPPDTAVDQVKPRATPPVPPAKPSRKVWLLSLGVLLIVGALVAIFWPRGGDNPSPGPFVEGNRDAVKDHSKTTENTNPKDRDIKKSESDPPKQTTNNKTTENPTPPKAIAKAIMSGMTPEVAVKRAQNPAVPPAEVRQLDYDRLDLWGTLPEKTQQVVFSGDGTRAAARAGVTITPFDLRERKSLERMFPLKLAPGASLSAEQTVGPIALSTDGKQLVFATLNTTTRKVRGSTMAFAEYDTLARVESGKATLHYGDSATGGEEPQILTRAVAFSPDGKHLIAAWPKKLVRWDLTRQEDYHDRYTELRLAEDKECLALDRDSKRFVMGCRDGKVYLLPTALDSDGVLAMFQGAETPIRALAFVGKDGLLSGDNTGRLCVWKVPEKPTTDTINPQEKRDGWHTKEITTITTTAGTFATGSIDGKVHLGKLGVKKPELTIDLGEPIRALSFTQDGKGLLVATERKIGVIQLQPPAVAWAKP